jgi:hypothetical protein
MELNLKTEVRELSHCKPQDVEQLFAKRAAELHKKIDQTRDAYQGFIFPVNQRDLLTVADALGIDRATTRSLFSAGRAFSTFHPPGKRAGQITNHIFGASILALRGKSLETGLASITNESLLDFTRHNEDIISEVADARSSWFGRIYFPASAFASAIAVFGGKASADSVFDVANEHGFAAVAGERKTVRGDFGIAVWLTLLAHA